MRLRSKSVQVSKPDSHESRNGTRKLARSVAESQRANRVDSVLFLMLCSHMNSEQSFAQILSRCATNERLKCLQLIQVLFTFHLSLKLYGKTIANKLMCIRRIAISQSRLRCSMQIGQFPSRPIQYSTSTEQSNWISYCLHSIIEAQQDLASYN